MKRGPKAYKQRVHLSFGMTPHLRCNTPNGARVEAHSLDWEFTHPTFIDKEFVLFGRLPLDPQQPMEK